MSTLPAADIERAPVDREEIRRLLAIIDKNPRQAKERLTATEMRAIADALSAFIESDAGAVALPETNGTAHPTAELASARELLTWVLGACTDNTIASVIEDWMKEHA